MIDQIMRVITGEKIVSRHHGGGAKALEQYNELIAYIGVLEAFVSQYKPGPMLTDGRPECLTGVLPTPSSDGEW